MHGRRGAPIFADVLRVWIRSRGGFACAVILVLVLGMSLRAAAAVYWQSALVDDGIPFRFGDSDSYWVHAKRIAEGEPYQYSGENSRIFRAPLYPLFLAGVIRGSDLLHGDGANDLPQSERESNRVLAARMAGALLGTLSIAMIIYLAYQVDFYLGKSIGRCGDGDVESPFQSRLSGLMAGTFAALYPGAVGMSIFILSEAISCPLMILSILASWRAIRACFPTHALGWAFLAGISTGAVCLARPSWSLWGIAFGLYLLIAVCWDQVCKARHANDKDLSNASKSCVLGLTFWDGVKQLGVMGLGIVLVMSPWWWRNYEITGKFVPTTLQVGASLYDGLHAGASGSSDEGMEFVYRFWDEQNEEDNERLSRDIPLESTYEWRIDRRMRDAAVSWVAENPAEAMWLGWVKLGKTWRPVPVASEVGSAWIQYSEAIAYLGILTSGLIGAWGTRKELGAWLFLAPCLYFSAIHMVFIGSIRYRQPAVLVLCVLAGIGAGYLVTLAIRKSSSQVRMP